MKKTKIILAMSAAILSTAAFLVTKASKKFVTVPRAFAGNLVTVTASAGHSFNTVKGIGLVTVFFATANGNTITLRTGRTASTKVAYYH